MLTRRDCLKTGVALGAGLISLPAIANIEPVKLPDIIWGPELHTDCISYTVTNFKEKEELQKIIDKVNVLDSNLIMEDIKNHILNKHKDIKYLNEIVIDIQCDFYKPQDIDNPHIKQLLKRMYSLRFNNGNINRIVYQDGYYIVYFI